MAYPQAMDKRRKKQRIGLSPLLCFVRNCFAGAIILNAVALKGKSVENAEHTSVFRCICEIQSDCAEF